MVNSQSACRRQEIDGPYSWLVAVCGAYCFGVSVGMIRSQGILYKATMQTYHISREQVSWPYSVFLVAFFMVGPFCGILGKIFGIRKILFAFASLCSTGLIISFFCQGMVCLSLSYGLLTGLGIGSISILVPQMVSQHFKKHRSSAIGITLSGSCIASILMPSLIESMLFCYGFRGTFLLLSGFTLNVIVVGSLMKPPSKQYSSDVDDRSAISHQGGEGSLAVVVQMSTQRARKGSLNWTNGQNEWEDEGHKGPSMPTSESGQTKNSAVRNTAVLDSEELRATRHKKGTCKDLRFVLLILRSPMFLVFCMTFCAGYLNLFVYCTIIIDFAMDKGVHSDPKYIIMTFVVAELGGRIGLGWITDKGFLSKRTYIILSKLLSATAISCHPFTSNFYGLIVLSILYGIAHSGMSTMAIVLTEDYLGRNNYSVSAGLISFIITPVPFIFPALIGYFRDGSGSYNGVFYTVAGFSLISVLLWLSEPLITRRSQATSVQAHACN